jgi:cell division protease FtsH
LSHDYALDRIAICLGGRIAEEITFGEKTTGAGNDLDQATDMARKMVCEWGMSDVMGPLTFGKKEDTVFLGREIANAPTYSEQTAQEIDAEIKSIVTTQYARARKIIEDNAVQLKRVAEALLEYETLDGQELVTVMDGNPITRQKPTPAPQAAASSPKPEIKIIPEFAPQPTKA